jgi:hypothetical protein
MLPGKPVGRAGPNLGRQDDPILQRQQPNELHGYAHWSVRGLKGGNQRVLALTLGAKKLAGFGEVLCG